MCHFIFQFYLVQCREDLMPHLVVSIVLPSQLQQTSEHTEVDNAIKELLLL